MSHDVFFSLFISDTEWLGKQRPVFTICYQKSLSSMLQSL